MSGDPSLLVKPAYLHVPHYSETDGDEVAGLAEDAGFGPDETQQLCLDVIFARDPSGRSAAFESWIIACRQNLKTGVQKQAVLGWLYLFACDPVIWTAHEWDTVAEAFVDLDNLISGSPYLSRQVLAVSRGERDQQITLRNGGRLLFKTRTAGGGRGLAGEKVILDEGWRLRKTHLGSFVPTMSARSISGDPQMLGGSSAAHADSEVLHPVIARGRKAATSRAGSAADRRLFYIEFCAPDPAVSCERGAKCDHELRTPGCGCDNPDLITAANPAVNRRISLDFIMTSERRAMPGAEFGRERMGWHDAPQGDSEVIPVAAWAEGIDEESDPDGMVSLAVVFSGDRRRAAVGLVGHRPDGLWHVEVAEYREGTSWVVPWVKLRCTAPADGSDPPPEYIGDRVAAVAVDDHSHEAVIIPELEAAGIEVFRMSSAEVGLAYGMFFDAVTDEAGPRLRHRNQDDLTLALAGATTRSIGDAGTAWGRRKSGVDIAPLVAVTEAMYAHSVRAPLAESEPGAWLI